MSISKICSYQPIAPRFEYKEQNESKKSYLSELATKIQNLFSRAISFLKGIFCCRSSVQQSQLNSKSEMVNLSKSQKNIPLRNIVDASATPKKSVDSTIPNKYADQSIPKKDSDLKIPKKTVDKTTSKKSNFEKLPNVLLPAVASFLDYKDVLSLEKVSKICKQSVNTEVTWKKLFARDLGNTQGPFTKAVYKETLMAAKVGKWVHSNYYFQLMYERRDDEAMRKRSRESCAKINNRILQVMKDPDYQKDPTAYIKDWIKRRGNTEELRFPDDPALRYFRKEILKDNSY